MQLHDLAKMIDHSLLHPTMTDAQITAGCGLACKHDVATVCVKPYAIDLAQRTLEGSNVGICSVVTFPHGNSTMRIKVAETQEALNANNMSSKLSVLVTGTQRCVVGYLAVEKVIDWD